MSFAIPEGLSPQGQKAAEAIVSYLKDNELLYSGGGKVFYTPEEWKARGEDYGTESLLVITHDGGDHAPVFNMGYGAYELMDGLIPFLAEQGFFVEACTGWYSAVYHLKETKVFSLGL